MHRGTQKTIGIWRSIYVVDASFEIFIETNWDVCYTINQNSKIRPICQDLSQIRWTFRVGRLFGFDLPVPIIYFVYFARRTLKLDLYEKIFSFTRFCLLYVHGILSLEMLKIKFCWWVYGTWIFCRWIYSTKNFADEYIEHKYFAAEYIEQKTLQMNMEPGQNLRLHISLLSLLCLLAPATSRIGEYFFRFSFVCFFV